MAKTLYRKNFEHDSCGIGVIASIKGVRSRSIIEDSLGLLNNLDHRGARGADTDTGDGAGILIQIPHRFFKTTLNFDIPKEGEYGVAMIFVSHYENERKIQLTILEKRIAELRLDYIGKREVPINPECLGKAAYESMPYVFQIFVGKGRFDVEGIGFERLLYTIRKHVENEIREHIEEKIRNFYFCSFSAKTIVYKGMLIPRQLRVFYPDLNSTYMESSIALSHSRFSTNTFPSWDRAHPNRMLIHNGEINTIKGNIKWIRSREKNMKSRFFDDDRLKSVFPIINSDGSDSAMFDNTIEFLYLNGYSLAHAVMMMIPEPWEMNPDMDSDKRAFYEYHSFLMESWDGPAAMALTDGDVIAASLDRNGLRPSRYYVTADDRIVLASEVGVLDIPEADIIHKGRLEPGKMLLIDTVRGRIINDDELKREITTQKPYRKWIEENTIDLEAIEPEIRKKSYSRSQNVRFQRIFGYTYEDINKVIKPMAENGIEGVAAMGIDAPLAVLSEKPQLLYNYFKQLFAQVTNPPIDAIREEIVTGSETSLGSDGDMLNPDEKAARRIRVHNPILTNVEMDKIKNLDQEDFKSKVIPIMYDIQKKGSGLEDALEELFNIADESVANGYNLLILSDRFADRKKGPIPALLAVSALNQHMVRNGNRTKANIIVETGEARETHHFATLIGYGASAIHPYIVFDILKDMVKRNFLETDYETARKNYSKASLKGIIKILSKMGISTIKSYRGAQIFECIGINEDVVQKHFTGTESRISGISIDEIAYDLKKEHDKAFEADIDEPLESGGDYQYREGEEYHMYNPQTIYTLQKATRENDKEIYNEFARLIHEDPETKSTLRSLLEFDFNQNPIPLEEVEPVEDIYKRFKTGAMSYGSISLEAHECIAIAMNRIGGKSNTGEGGEDPRRFKEMADGDSKCSAIKQVASGRFGVNIEYLNNAKEIQIKMAQGAKPGEGGQLPGVKVYPWIAETRNSTTGVGLISPPPHHDIYSIEDLGQLIHDLKSANKDADISVKLVSLAGVGTVAAGVAKAKADIILISGYDGGTGAAPRTSLRHAGLPWELGLSETHQTLVMNNLRGRVKLETDGKLMTGRDVVVAALLGAEEYGFATAPLVIVGCIMMRFCNLDTCPVGVATQNPELRKCFSGKPEYIENYFRFIAEEIRGFMAWLGFRTIDEMIGRVDKLKIKKEVIRHPKYKNIDLSQILVKPDVPAHYDVKNVEKQDHDLKKTLDFETLIPMCKNAIIKGERMKACINIKNTDRSVGAMTAGLIARKFGMKGLDNNTIDITFLGSAGQSFGAFIPKGIVFTLVGDANDYVGKGLSGGKIIVKRDRSFSGTAADNIIVGNVALYGAIDGEVYIEGVAGERFCVRNSGATAVVEGVGAHACEYMTGGRTVILGPTGSNFAAGMSGGIAYIYNQMGDFENNLNREMVESSNLVDNKEIEWLKNVIRQHFENTDSKIAKIIISDLDNEVKKFVRVIPRDYKRMNDAIEEAVVSGMSIQEARMKAFYENATQESRISGN